MSRLIDCPTYRIWRDMKKRCYVSSSSNFQHYGGRGIRVCSDWINSYPTFLKDMGERPDGYELDRVDSNGHYCKENCRWATRHEQVRNKRNNVWLEYQGRRMVAVDWARELGISRHTIRHRIILGWNDERVLGEPTWKTKLVALNAKSY